MRIDRDTILRQLRDAKPALQREFPLRKIGLFGSVARRDESAGSDIDILVEVDPSIGIEFTTLADRLEQLLGGKVDLFSRRALKPALLRQIEAELIDV